MFRYFLCFVGFLLAIPLMVLVTLVFGLPVTIWGILYLFGAVITVVGMIIAPRVSWYSIPAAGGILIIVLVAGLRLSLTQNTNAHTKVVALPSEKGTASINTLIDEQDALVFGETVFHYIGGNSQSEHKNLDSAFAQVYSRMRKEGNFSSPIASTYLNLQRPDHFDAVIVDPETEPHFGLVFLHGYMGNVTAQCWVIGKAVKGLGGLTICPSTAWTGEWWQPEGQLILRSTFSYLREHGIQSIYLGGFSNGGFSIGRLASPLAKDHGLAGLIFIDGFVNGQDIRELGLPVLVIEGTRDERVPVEAARRFVEEVGDLGTYVEVDSDHFLVMKEPDLVQAAIATWLKERVIKANLVFQL